MLRFNSVSGDAKKNDPIVLGQSLRAAYLLGDKVYVTGSGHMAVNFEDYLKNPSDQLKKHMVLRYAGRVADPNYLKEVERMYAVLKNGRDIKHPPKEVLVARARCEKTLEQLYQSSVTDMKQLYTLCGFTGLQHLKEDGILETIGALKNSKEYDGPHLYTECLETKWNKYDEIYTIIPPFWDYLEAERLITAQNDETPKADVFIYSLPSFTWLNNYTPGEMRAIRQEVFGEANDFRQAIADWSLQLKEQDFSPDLGANYYAYYTTNILPHLADIQRKLDGCSIIQKFKELTDQLGCENYLAITSAKTIWEYMAWSEVIPKQALYDFEQNFPESGNADKAVLVLLCKPLELKSELEDISDKRNLVL
jgi:hypothetical protein